MRQTIAVYKRELALLFRSPIAYAVAFALLLFLGVLYSGQLSQIVQYNQFAGQQGAQPVGASELNLTTGVLVFLLFLVGPLLTMRLLAEESREGTIETLMTLPMNEGHFIVGKFLAVWTFYTIVLVITLVYHVIGHQVGVPDDGAAFPDDGAAFGQYVGAWLYGGAVLAVCMIWSAVTEDQIVAAFLSAATVLVLYLAERSHQPEQCAGAFRSVEFCPRTWFTGAL